MCRITYFHTSGHSNHHNRRHENLESYNLMINKLLYCVRNKTRVTNTLFVSRAIRHEGRYASFTK